MVQKLRCGRPCTHAHMTYQAPTTGLHSPTLLSFLQHSTKYLMLAKSQRGMTEEMSKYVPFFAL